MNIHTFVVVVVLYVLSGLGGDIGLELDLYMARLVVRNGCHSKDTCCNGEEIMCSRFDIDTILGLIVVDRIDRTNVIT